MFNLELESIEFDNTLPENICDNATHVAASPSQIFLIKDGELEVYDRLENNTKVIYYDDDVPALEPESIIDFSYLSFEEILWIATPKLFLIIISLDRHATLIQEKECSVCEWSPNQTEVATIYNDGEIRTYRFDLNNSFLVLLHSGHLNDENCTKPNVDIGWGSETTQFDHSKIKKITKGADAKGPKISHYDFEIPVILRDFVYPKLCWKPDGTKFVVNYYTEGKRRIKIYAKDCSLVFVYQDIAGIQSHIKWRPNTNQISTILWTNKRYCFVLLGRSSLEKHTFDLQHEDLIEELKWDQTGRKLAIRQSNSEGMAMINLYMCQNFEWHLKQYLVFTPYNSLVTFDFRTELNQCVLQVTTFKEILRYRFKVAIHCKGDVAGKGGITVAVIDGKKICLSVCQEGLIPAPLYSLIIPTKIPVNFVTFHPLKQILATLDSKNVLNIYSYSTYQFELISEYKIPCVNITEVPLRIRNICWRNDQQVACLIDESHSSKKMSHLCYLNMHGDSEEWSFLPNILGDQNLNYVNVLTNSETLIISSKNTVALVEGEVMKTLVVQPLAPLYMDLVVVDSNTYVFGLTDTHTFMVNDVVVHKLIRCFLIHDNYLILLTDESQLIVVRLDSNSLQNLYESKFDDFYVRAIDKESHLLFSIHNTSIIVTENRRGNLEFYSCHIITVDRVELLLQNNKWIEALSIVRLEKLDYNVIIDLNVQRFLNNINTFLEAIESLGLLNEFLIYLNDCDVFQTVYKNCARKSIMMLENKSTMVCNALIKCMSDYNYVHYISSIAIAEIMKSEPLITEALEHIYFLLSISTQQHSYVDIAESTLKTIQTLKRDLKLYNTALSMYNLPLAVFIASVTSMDPAEYRPFISSLEIVSEYHKRFLINKFLERYRDGLPYLIQFATDDVIFHYIVLHDLAIVALPQLEYKSNLFYKVLDVLVTKLDAKRKYEEAAALYSKVNFKVCALNQYVLGLLWKPAVELLDELKIEGDSRSSFLQYLVIGLTKKGNVVDVAYLLDKYLSFHCKASTMLINQDRFISAFEIARKHDFKHIIVHKFNMGIEKYFTALEESIEEMEQQFKKYIKRLIEVRKQKRSTFFEIINPSSISHNVTVQDSDEVRSCGDSVISVMSTHSSRAGFTVKPYRRGKAERKKESLREGSHFEDIALIKALYNLIDLAFQYGPEMRKLLLLIIAENLKIDLCLKNVHKKLLLLQKDMSAAVKDIWPTEMNKYYRNNYMIPNSFIYQNISELDVKYRTHPANLHMDWTLEIYLD